MQKKVQIYSDWWARPNPWPWGYGVILRFGKKEKELSGFEKYTTNNRMELTGVIKWLEELKEKFDYLASRLETWNVFWNKIPTLYPFLPYGWVKDSWYWKELWERGMKNFCNEKVVVF
jgi:ribonuclease HI